MPISTADRAYLSQEWRWLETANAAVLAQHPGAREADYGSAFMTVAGAQVALDIISAITNPTNRLIVARVAGIPTFSFKTRPPMVRLYHDRFGGDAVNGQLFMVEAAEINYGTSETTLHLVG